MPRGVYQHPTKIRPGESCIRCGLADPTKLYPCSLVRYYAKPDGRRAGRSLGPVRVCRACAVELLRTPRRQGPLAPEVRGSATG